MQPALHNMGTIEAPIARRLKRIRLMTVPVYDYGHRLRISTAQLGEADLSLLRDVPSSARGGVYAQMGRTHRPTAFTAYVPLDLDTVTACINSHVNARVAGAGGGDSEAVLDLLLR
jgi:hypothetical protein